MYKINKEQTADCTIIVCCLQCEHLNQRHTSQLIHANEIGTLPRHLEHGSEPTKTTLKNTKHHNDEECFASKKPLMKSLTRNAIGKIGANGIPQQTEETQLGTRSQALDQISHVRDIIVVQRQAT